MTNGAALLAEFTSGASYADLMRRHHLTKGQVAGALRRARIGTPTPATIETLQAKLNEVTTELTLLKIQHQATFRPSARDDNDMGLYVDLVRRYQKQGTIRAMVWNDIHFNDHDPQAMALAYQIHRAFQPNVNVCGSDCFDFDTLSLHYNRSHDRVQRDAFKEVKPNWENHISQLKTDNPNVPCIAIGGNHDRGRVEALVDSMPMLGDTIMEDYHDLIRWDGQVLWLGWQDEIRMGPALFEHGERTGPNAAANSLKDRGYLSPKVQGHTHTPSWAINVAFDTAEDGVTQTRRIVQSVVTGCLCRLYASYQRHKTKSRWVHGVGLVHINMQGRDVHVQNCLFHPREDGSLVAVLGADLFVQKPVEGMSWRVA